jgi:signal peptidase II
METGSSVVLSETTDSGSKRLTWISAILAYTISGLVFWIDFITKAWAERNLLYGVDNYILPFFDLTLLYNRGAAFSFLSDAGGWQRYFFVAIAAAVSIALCVWIPKLKLLGERLGCGLILGGALGNLYDRVVYGHVIDFVSLHWQDYYWPAFNVADSAITLGAVILLFEWVLLNRSGDTSK